MPCSSPADQGGFGISQLERFVRVNEQRSAEENAIKIGAHKNKGTPNVGGAPSPRRALRALPRALARRRGGGQRPCAKRPVHRYARPRWRGPRLSPALGAFYLRRCRAQRRPASAVPL